MARRKDDVDKLVAIIMGVEEMEGALPPDYEPLGDSLQMARGQARRSLGVLLADLELEARGLA